MYIDTNFLTQALANCEETDNQSEQAKQRGTVVTYGEIIEVSVLYFLKQRCGR